MIANSTIVSRTINTLNALTAQGLKFYIEMPDGKTYGNVKLKGKKGKRNEYRPFGSVRAIMTQFLSNMDMGDVVQIPIPPTFEREEFRSRVCSYLHDTWGKETYKTAVTKDVVEVLRLV